MPVGRSDHARSRGGHGRVVVQHAEHDRLEQHGFGESATHRQHRRARHVNLALAVALDLAREAVVGEEGERWIINDVLFGEPIEFGHPEAKFGDGVKHAARAREHAVAPLTGQPPPEHLENAVTTAAP